LVDEIFQYWRMVMGKGPRVQKTKERVSRVKARLKKYTPEEIKQAIDGCKRSAHHQGQNDTGTIYDDLELICRTDTKLEKFIEASATINPDAQREAEVMAWVNGKDENQGETYEHGRH